jgi:hypothetical protein
VSRRWILIEKRRKIHPTRTMVAFGSINGSNLWSDPAHDEVFEDLRHFWKIVNGRIAISSSLSPIWNRRERRGSSKIWFSLFLPMVNLNVNVNL